MCFYQNSTSKMQKTVNEASGSLYLSCSKVFYWKPTYSTMFVSYLQNMNTSGFRTCVKELYVTRYDPVSVSYAVVAGKIVLLFLVEQEIMPANLLNIKR